MHVLLVVLNWYSIILTDRAILDKIYIVYSILQVQSSFIVRAPSLVVTCSTTLIYLA